MHGGSTCGVGGWGGNLHHEQLGEAAGSHSCGRSELPDVRVSWSPFDHVSDHQCGVGNPCSLSIPKDLVIQEDLKEASENARVVEG